MTKLAIKRRQNIRAMRTLISKHQFPQEYFKISRGKDDDRLPGMPFFMQETPEPLGYYDELQTEIEPTEILREVEDIWLGAAPPFQE